MQYSNSTFDDFRLLLELERVLQLKCTLAQTIFFLFLNYLRAVWFTGVALLCKSKEQKQKYNKSKDNFTMNHSNIHKFKQIIVETHGRFVILQLHNDERDKEKRNQACNTQHHHLVGIHTENAQTSNIFI